MKPKNGNPEHLVHSIKILLRGIDTPLFYVISETEKERLAGFFATDDDELRAPPSKEFYGV